MIDVLLRAQRDLASAEAFFIRATARRQTVPTEVVTDKHQAYVGAVRKHVSEAMHVRSGLHRASGQTTKAIERSHLPVKDRLRPAHRPYRRIIGDYAYDARCLHALDARAAVSV